MSGLWRVMLCSLLVMATISMKTEAQVRLRKAEKVVVVKRGRVVKRVPSRTVVVAHRGTAYRFANGVFYRPKGKRFVVIAPPVGIRVRSLPAARVRVRVGRSAFFYFNGTFYRKLNANQGYEVVQPPLGAQVPELPEGTELVILNGEKYHELDGYYYQEFITNNNQLMYEVVSIAETAD